MSSLTDIFGPVIHTYTRERGIADGVLVDVSETAREAGFTYPVAMTVDAWHAVVAWDADRDGKGRCVMQDEPGRLWDVVNMARFGIARSGQAASDRLTFELYVVPPAPSRAVHPRRTSLVLVCGPGDQAEPVITIMLPGES